VGRSDTTKGYDIFKTVAEYTYKDVFWIQCLSTGGLKDVAISSIPKTFYEVSNDIMPEIYNLADFVFKPSRYEGFGYTVVEAFACKVPVISLYTGIFKIFSKIVPDLCIGYPKNELESIIERSLKTIKIEVQGKADLFK